MTPPTYLEMAANSVGSRRERGQAKDELDSEFEADDVVKRKSWKDDPLASKPVFGSEKSSGVPSKAFFELQRDKEDRRTRRFHLLSLDAYSRHKLLVNQYILSKGRGVEHFVRDSSGDRNDFDVLRSQHQFLWGVSDQVDSWEKRLAKAYYDKLFKEYAIADLSRYRERKVALRWRTEKEVVVGKGQFVCGSRLCSAREGLVSWEVNFAYVEGGVRKNALVKVRLCSGCSKKLNACHKCKQWRGSKDRVGSGEVPAPAAVCRDTSATSVGVEGHSKKHTLLQGGHANSCCSSGGQSPQQPTDGPSDYDVWKQPAVSLQRAGQDTASKEEQFDDYFKDMLM